jgi:hypothetical protein
MRLDTTTCVVIGVLSFADHVCSRCADEDVDAELQVFRVLVRVLA